jgi:hypothetical protein
MILAPPGGQILQLATIGKPSKGQPFLIKHLEAKSFNMTIFLILANALQP